MTSKFLSLFRSAAKAEPGDSLRAQIEQARALHQQGQLEEATTLYGAILRTHPDSAEAHYRHANVLKDQGQLETALAGYDRAIALKSDYSQAFCNQAVVLGLMQRLPEALAGYDRAIALDPADVIAHCNRGVLLNGMGQKDAALSSFDNAIAHNADYFPAHFYRGALLQERRDFVASLRSYDRAIAINTGDALTHYNRGTVLRELARWDAALSSYDRAIALDGEFFLAHAGRAEVLQKLTRFSASLHSYNRAIELKPHDATTYNNRGVVLQKMGEFDAALSSYSQAITADPNYSEAYFNRGTALQKLDKFTDALASYDLAISANPRYPEAYLNRGAALEEMGLLDQAIASFNQAISINPDFPEGRFNLAMASLKAGDFVTGWINYEWRWRATTGAIFREKRDFREPLWLGKEVIAGKTVLLYGEQGLGDSLQFSRYAQMVTNLGARVVLEVPQPLVKLCTTLGGVAEVIPYGNALPSFDFQCPLMSLPLAFETTLVTVPSATKYLNCEEGKIAAWNARLGAKVKPRVGLTWSGRQTGETNRKRHFLLSKLLPYLSDELQYFCLQTEVTEADRKTLAKNPVIFDFSEALDDLSDTAALCECLDLIITIDTSVAHLSGALGKRTWVLLPFNADWRWLVGRYDSPWYPTMRLYRQKSQGDWNEVFERVSTDLRRVFNRGQG